MPIKGNPLKTSFQDLELYYQSNFVQQLSPLQTNWLYMMKTAAAHIQQNSNHRVKVEVPPCEPDIDSLHYSYWLSTVLLVCWICTLRNWECNFCAICAVFLMSLGQLPWPSIMAIFVPVALGCGRDYPWLLLHVATLSPFVHSYTLNNFMNFCRNSMILHMHSI